MLVLFGDSFASEWETCNHASWFELLAKELGIEYKTYGVHGTSFEYSTLKFYQYLSSEEYSPDDVIIFILTSPYRSPVINEDFNPNWAAMTYGKVFYEEQTSRDRRMLDERPDSDEHYNRYKTYYKDWFRLQNSDLILAQRYVLLKALHSLPNNTVSISGWDTEVPIKEHFNNHLCASLWQASENEIADGSIVDFMEKHGKDFRQNHFHEINHTILKDQVYSQLTTGSCNLTVDSFNKNLYTIK